MGLELRPIDFKTASAFVEKNHRHNKPPTIQWNVITKRPMDAEERKVASESLCYDIEDEEAYIYSNLPDDGEEVIICFSWGAVKIDTFRIEEGCYFEENGDMDGVVAWMLLPKPYAPTQSNDSKALDALDALEGKGEKNE